MSGPSHILGPAWTEKRAPGFPSSSRSTTRSEPRAPPPPADGCSRALGRALRARARRRRQHRRHAREARARSSARDPRVRKVILRRNFGQTAAMVGRLRPRARRRDRPDGRRPAERPGGHPAPGGEARRGLLDVVCGWRRHRQDALSRASSRRCIANWLISVAYRRAPARLRLHAQGLPRRACRGRAALRRDAPLHPGAGDQLDGASSPRCRSTTARAPRAEQVRHRSHPARRPRPHDRQVPALLRTRPAHLFGAGGVPSGGAAAPSSPLAVLKLVFGQPLGGSPLLLLGALRLIVTGVILVSMGLIGELLVRTYHESQGKPIYVVQERRPGTRPARSVGPLTRVLFLAESFHPILGGGETHVRRLGKALVSAGHAATVVTRRACRAWPVQESVDGIRVVRVPPPGPGRTGKFLMLPAALRAVVGEAPVHDVLVVRGTRVLGLPGLLAARASGLPVLNSRRRMVTESPGHWYA